MTQSRMGANIAIESLTWFLTSQCNLHCLHCCEEYDENYSKRVADIETQRIIDSVPNVAAWGVKLVHFLGGEPTLKPNFLAILEAFAAHGIATSFNTNAQLLTAGFVRELAARHVKNVTFSFEGPDDQTNDYIRGKGTFAQSIRAIEWLRDARLNDRTPSIAIEVGINRLWANRISDLKSLLDLTKPALVHLEATKAEGRAALHGRDLVLGCTELVSLLPIITKVVELHAGQVLVLPKFSPKLIEYGNRIAGTSLLPKESLCGAVAPQCYVTNNGKVFPCRYAVDVLGDSDAPSIGSSLEDVISSGLFRRFYVSYGSGVDEIPNECRHCGYHYVFCQICPLLCASKKAKQAELCGHAKRMIESTPAMKSSHESH